ncbi:MAG: hypothetical protein Q9159_007371 [Coniocarpon cinnabarinum]
MSPEHQADLARALDRALLPQPPPSAFHTQVDLSKWAPKNKSPTMKAQSKAKQAPDDAVDKQLSRRIQDLNLAERATKRRLERERVAKELAIRKTVHKERVRKISAQQNNSDSQNSDEMVVGSANGHPQSIHNPKTSSYGRLDQQDDEMAMDVDNADPTANNIKPAKPANLYYLPQTTYNPKAPVRGHLDKKHDPKAIDSDKAKTNVNTPQPATLHYLPQATYDATAPGRCRREKNDKTHNHKTHSSAIPSRRPKIYLELRPSPPDESYDGSANTTSPMDTAHEQIAGANTQNRYGIDLANPGEPDYNPAMLAAMENCPHITPDIWIKIYRSHVTHQIQSLTEFLYGSPHCSFTILGTPDEPHYRAQIAYLEVELIKVNHKFSQLHGTVGDRVRAEQQRKAEERARQLAYNEETDRRISERKWRKLEDQRQEVNRRFQEKERSSNQLINAEKAREIREFYENQLVIDQEEGKLASEAAMGATALQADMALRDEARALEHAALERADRDRAEQEDWESVKARWDWMINDMRMRAAAYAQARDLPKSEEAQERERQHLARDLSENTVAFDMYHQIRAEERRSVVTRQSPTKKSKGPVLGKVWRFMKRDRR